MSDMRVDVVVVGAGLSGLAAARTLTRRGASCVVLEAKDRVGGRTLSKRIGRATFDLGAQWIGPRQTRMQELVGELGITTFPTQSHGRKIVDIGPRRLRTYTGFVPPLGLLSLLDIARCLFKIERMRRRVPLDRPWLAPDALSLDGLTLEAWKERELRTADARDLLEIVVRSVLAVDSSELSVLHFLFYVNAGRGLLSVTSTKGGAQETRFVDGAQQVSLRMAAELGERTVLSSPVRRIAQRADALEVEANGAVYCARSAIVAVPAPFANQIVFDPPLDAALVRLHQQMPMRGSLKFIVAYDKPFWRGMGLSGEVISANTPLSVLFDNTSHDEAQPAIVGFVRGRAGDELGVRPQAERRQTVLDSLAVFFGNQALDPLAYDDQYWVSDPWCGGCHATFQPGAWTSTGEALRVPHGRVHFAGTERAERWHGYMEGAVRAGESAALAVLESLPR